MKPASSFAGRRRFCKRALLLLLLLAVPVLSTMAKRNWYLPKANAGHHLTAAVKMKAARAPAVVDRSPVQPIVAVVSVESVEPQTWSNLEEQQPKPFANTVELNASPQHRGPPQFSRS